MNSNEGEKLISNSNENDKNEKPVANDENSSKDDSPKVNEEAAKDEKPEIKKKIVYRKPRNQVESEQKKMQLFLSPMLDDLDRLLAENMKELDKIEEEFNLDTSKNDYLRSVAHVPEELREKKSIELIMKSLEELILNSKEETNQPSSMYPSQKEAHAFLQHLFPNEEAQEEKHNNESNNDEEAISESPESIISKSENINKLNKIACLAHSLTSYLITIKSKKNIEELKNLTIKLYDSVNIWVSRLFRFHNSSILFHDQESDGLIRMCNMVLNFKYKNYQAEGYQVIKKQPAIYISAASKYSSAEYKEIISIQLSLPLSSIREVKVSKSIDSELDKIDIPLFLKQLEEDVANDFFPLLLIANAGSYNIGQCDDIQQLGNVCTKYTLWLHLEGVYLSTLILYSIPTAIQPIASGDSITLDLSSWIGVPCLSYITLYKNYPNSSTYIQPFNGYLPTLQRCLPYWCVLQSIGHQGVMDRIKYAVDVSAYLEDLIKKQKPYLKTLSFKDIKKTDKKTERYTFNQLIAQTFSFLTFVDLSNPIIIFKCDERVITERNFLYGDTLLKKNNSKPENKVKENFIKMMQDIDPLFPKDDIKARNGVGKENDGEKLENENEIKDYADALTTWLCDLLNSLHKNMEFDLIEIENEGLCIRYSSLEHCNLCGTNEKDLTNFEKSIKEIIQILDSSIRCKSSFKTTIKEFKNLVPVNIQKWAGIGAVRYIPDYLLQKLEHDLAQEEPAKPTDESQVSINENKSTNGTNEEIIIKPNDRFNKFMEHHAKEINEINEKLIKNLQAQDSAFSQGETSDKMIAVKFGMVNEIDAVKKLAFQVQQVGKDIEESSRFIETMSDIIRKGIEKANEDLKKETEEKLKEEGVLRQIPYVSSLYNWLIPTQSQIVGRTFDLQSGKIYSTEEISKYHMQIEKKHEESSEESKNRAPSSSSQLTVTSDIGEQPAQDNLK